MPHVRIRRLPPIAWSVLLLALFFLPNLAAGAADPFPVYDCVRPNVTFWKKVYSEYSLNQGVIHDSDNLGVIYGVIRFMGDDEPGAGRTNRQRTKAAKEKYRAILSRLAAGKNPASAEEKRVLGLFGPNPSRHTLGEASRSVRVQRGQKDRFREGVIRSGAYLDMAKQEFRKQGLPEDLAYLAHVESSFNVQAYSKFGAAGIWQFTRGTGKRFMRIDYTVDERRDPFCATRAAARYLKENFERLGSWPVAITAYNHGANGMRRAVDKKGDYPAIFAEYEGRLFGFASRNFYSEFLAAREVAKNYRRYFGALTLDRPQHFYEFKLAGYVPLSELADHFQVGVDTIARLNPALRKPLFSGQKYVPKGYRLRLPRRGAHVVAMAREFPHSLYHSKQRPSRFYEVRRGDTAGRIARRHGISLHRLILANQLDNRATVYVGQNLRIPGAEERVQVAAVSAKKTVVRQQVAKQKEEAKSTATLKAQTKKAPLAVVEVVAPTAPTPPATAKVVAPVKVAMVVPAADKARPATRSAMTVATDSVVPLLGEKQALVDAPVNPAVVYGHLKVEQVQGKGTHRYGVISVEAGETLGHYAEWLEVRARDLRRLNRLRFGSTLRLNQQLRVPLAKVDHEQFEERRFEYHKEIEEDFFAAYRIEEMRNYQIKKGDNIWQLSNDEFEVPFWLIKKYNAAVDFAAIQPDQELLVPVVVEKVDQRLSSPDHSPLPTG